MCWLISPQMQQRLPIAAALLTSCWCALLLLVGTAASCWRCLLVAATGGRRVPHIVLVVCPCCMFLCHALQAKTPAALVRCVELEGVFVFATTDDADGNLLVPHHVLRALVLHPVNFWPPGHLLCGCLLLPDFCCDAVCGKQPLLAIFVGTFLWDRVWV